MNWHYGKNNRNILSWLVLFGTTLGQLCQGWSSVQPPRSNNQRLFLAETTTTTTTTTTSSSSSIPDTTMISGSKPRIQIVPCPNDDDEAIARDAAFMVDSYWLGSPRQMTHIMANSNISEEARSKLVQQQTADFLAKYGQLMGKRLCYSLLLEAHDDDDEALGNQHSPSFSSLLGIVGLEETLFDQNARVVFPMQRAEAKLKNAVASLSPQQRKEYKDASLPKIATELLAEKEPHIVPICCLSNLAVSPRARRRGIGTQLCLQVENLARILGYSSLALKLELDNDIARQLYEQGLGYTVQCEIDQDCAWRANPETGEFLVTTIPTLLLSKKL